MFRLLLPAYCFLLFFVWANKGISQSKKRIAPPPDPKEVELKFNNKNYKAALEGYLRLLEDEPKNKLYIYNVGLCYLNSNVSKPKAIPYLEKSVREQDPAPDAIFYLARSYHYGLKFDDAIKYYTEYKEKGKGNSEYLRNVDKHIQECTLGKQLIKFPVNVKFENLGKNINSAYADYAPYLPEDESSIIYNTRRPDGQFMNVVDLDGTHISSIFYSKIKDSEFLKAKNIGSPINNGEGDMEVVGLSPNGDYMLLWRYDATLGMAGMFMSTLEKNKSYKRSQVIDDGINNTTRIISACISNDGNMLIFASDRGARNNKVDKDLFVSRLLPTGKWGVPQSLGNAINSEMDEDFPNLSPDGKTLYFASEGHNGMGGFDIYKAEWNENTQSWGNLKNAGYPINTPDDDRYFRPCSNGRYAYISAVRDEGLGDFDIYRLTFNNVEAKYIVLSGEIQSADTLHKVPFSDVFITVTNINSGEIYGNYIPNKQNGHYVIVIPPGDYEISVEAPGFDANTEKVTFSEKIRYEQENIKNIILYKNGSKTAIPSTPAK